MEAKKDSGILFSRVLVLVFGGLILILDWAVWPISRWLMRFIVDMQFRDTVLLIICLYVCNVPGFVLLWCMDKLLRNLRQGKVFDSDNVELLKNISICCFVVSIISLSLCARIYFLGVVALMTAFMGLVVRIVKNVFSSAIAMRSELDLTV